MTIQIDNQAHYDRVLEFARKRGLSAQLEQLLDYLRTYADHEQTGACVVHLQWDYAPASFSLLWERNGRPWFSGGLIFHGSQEGWGNDSHVDPLSVRISADENPWSIHT